LSLFEHSFPPATGTAGLVDHGDLVPVDADVHTPGKSTLPASGKFDFRHRFQRTHVGKLGIERATLKTILIFCLTSPPAPPNLTSIFKIGLRSV
jgi:hypothetical protein